MLRVYSSNQGLQKPMDLCLELILDLRETQERVREERETKRVREERDKERKRGREEKE